MDSLKKHLGLARKLQMPLTPKHHLWMHLVLRIEYGSKNLESQSETILCLRFDFSF